MKLDVFNSPALNVRPNAEMPIHHLSGVKAEPVALFSATEAPAVSRPKILAQRSARWTRRDAH